VGLEALGTDTRARRRLLVTAMSVEPRDASCGARLMRPLALY
jgi:hypothetical protein